MVRLHRFMEKIVLFSNSSEILQLMLGVRISALSEIWPFTLHLIARVNCPCPEQGQNPNSQLSSAISASVLPIEPQDHNQQPIHRKRVNGLVTIFRFCW